MEGIADFLHEDYALVLVHPAGGDRASGRVAAHTARTTSCTPTTSSSRTVSVNGEVAMVLHSAEQHATVLGGDRSGRFVISDCWLRGADGAWRVWRRHSTPLRAGVMPRE